MQQTANRLRSVLLEFYPQALAAFPNLLHKAAQAVLAAVPTPALGARLTPRRIVALLHRVGRRNDPALSSTSGQLWPAMPCASRPRSRPPSARPLRRY
jgi:hypothetical protein